MELCVCVCVVLRSVRRGNGGGVRGGAGRDGRAELVIGQQPGKGGGKTKGWGKKNCEGCRYLKHRPQKIIQTTKNDDAA